MSGTANPPAAATTFRDQSDAISPPWLNGATGKAYRYSMSVMYDALADAGSYAVRFALPTYAPADALPWIQLDRQVDQGPNEPIASYTIRLRQWLDLWRVAGSARAVLRAITSYMTPLTTTIETVNDAVGGVNAWNTSVAGSDPPTYVTTAVIWNWDNSDQPGRAWVVIYNGPWAQSPTWGSFHYADGTCYGATFTTGDGGSIRGLVKKWKTGSCVVPEVIVAFDATWFLPTSITAKLPDGTYGHWGKIQASTTGNVSEQWGQVVTVGTTRTYQPKVSHTVVSGTFRAYIPARTSTACYLGPVN